MTVICASCGKMGEIPDPPGYAEMSVIDKLCAHQGYDHMLCSDCMRRLLIVREAEKCQQILKLY